MTAGPEHQAGGGDALTRAIVEVALDCVIVMDEQGACREFNPAAERVFGHPRKAVIGRQPETLEESDRKHILAALESSNWVIAGPNGAAARLGMKRSTLQFRIRKLGIVKPGTDRRRP